MGLDMYLYKCDKSEKIEKALEEGSVTLLTSWIKANHIHAWFERNLVKKKDSELVNLKPYRVSKKQLEILLEDCRRVKEIFSNATKTKGPVVSSYSLNGDGTMVENYTDGIVWEGLDVEAIEYILPTQSGFFFGSTEYDEWYYQNTEET